MNNEEKLIDIIDHSANRDEVIESVLSAITDLLRSSPQAAG